MAILLLVLIFVSTLVLVVGAYNFVNRRRLTDAQAVRARLSPTSAQTPSVEISILKEERASSLEMLNRLLSGTDFTATVAKELERAGSKQTVGAFVLTCALAATIGAFVGVRVGGTLLGVVFGVVCLALPYFNVRRMHRKRLKAFETQLPEAIDMLVSAMKAGYSLQAGMKFIGDEMAEPLGPEFARFYDEQRLGMEVRAALRAMQQRIDTLDLKMFITSLLIQRESGGNLSEILTNLSTLMRDRVAVRGQIDTLTAEPKLSAIVLSLLPLVLFFIFNVMNRDYMLPLYTTPMGHALLIYAAVSDLVGYLILRKLGDVDI